MTEKITTYPKGPTAAAPAPEHGCCGGEATAKSQNDASKLVEHERHERALTAKAADSSCCCGTTKDSGPTSTKGRSVASK